MDRYLKALASKELVGIPTETVYGLAADATSNQAVAKIFVLKNRPAFNPLIVHVDGTAMAQDYVAWNTLAEKLAQKFWPGPLTLVLPKKNNIISTLVTADLETLAVRCPNNPRTQQLIKQFGKPLAAPSANPSGRLSPTTTTHVKAYFPDLLVLEDGPCQAGLESTIVYCQQNNWQILRHGIVTEQVIQDYLGYPAGTLQKDRESSKPLSPGQLLKHYAPNKPVKLNVEVPDKNDGWLMFGTSNKASRPAAQYQLSTTKSLTEAAQNLYQGLATLDKTPCTRIAVMPIENKGIGIAINDRLRRAATA